jgi:hypothetical protein
VTYIPSETTPDEWADSVRVNEACDACWLWYVSYEETVTSADLDRQIAGLLS